MRPPQPRLVLFVLLLPLAAAPVARADIFGYKDERGVAHYSNVPVDSRFRLLIAVPGEVHSGTVSQWLRRSKPYSHLIDDAARANGLEPALIRAVLMAESGGDPRAVSPRGARGLMQLMPATARHEAKSLRLAYSASRLLADSHYNITLGRHYLEGLLDDFSGSYVLAIAAYNAGPGNVHRWIHEFGDPRNKSTDVIDWVEAIPLTETRNYVQRVLENLQIYRLRLNHNLAFSLASDLRR